MSSQSPTRALADRDVNAPISPSKNSSSSEKDNVAADKSRSLEYHRQVLQNRLAEDNSKQVYISPSDTIMSPCTKKLSEYKSKHFSKAKPQSLFAKMEANKKADAAKSGSGLGEPMEKPSA